MRSSGNPPSGSDSDSELELEDGVVQIFEKWKAAVERRVFVNASHKAQWLILFIGFILAEVRLDSKLLGEALKFADEEVEDKEVLHSSSRFKN